MERQIFLLMVNIAGSNPIHPRPETAFEGLVVAGFSKAEVAYGYKKKYEEQRPHLQFKIEEIIFWDEGDDE
jgi:hypothetical protein